MSAAYRDQERTRGLTAMTTLFESLRTGVSAILSELPNLGRSLVEGDFKGSCTFCGRPGTFKCPTEATSAASSICKAPS